MTLRELPKAEWQPYFDQVSKHLIGERAMVEIKGLAFGDQRLARCLPLIGITYDGKDNILEVAMDGLDHLIHAPHKIIGSDGADGLESIEVVVNASQQSQVVTLIKPLRYRRRTTSGE